ncbi:XRE family transcriptional regulator, partial [Citrobacter freundii]
MNINTAIAARLKQLREQKNMSQSKLAELC